MSVICCTRGECESSGQITLWPLTGNCSRKINANDSTTSVAISLGRHLKQQSSLTSKSPRNKQTPPKLTTEIGRKAPEWLDSPDIRKRYKDKPTQCEAVLANAAKLWHPTRELWVYEDYSFLSSDVDRVATGAKSSFSKDGKLQLS